MAIDCSEICVGGWLYAWQLLASLSLSSRSLSKTPQNKRKRFARACYAGYIRDVHTGYMRTVLCALVISRGE